MALMRRQCTQGSRLLLVVRLASIGPTQGETEHLRACQDVLTATTWRADGASGGGMAF